MEPVLNVDRITKRFKGMTAVDGVSFSVVRGEVAAILGPNGAGKSTTMHMLLGLLKPDGGSAELFGNAPGSKEARERIGVMLQDVSLMDAMKVREVLELIRGYYRNPMPHRDLLRLTGLSEEDLKKRAEKLSGGQKRRVSFALALAGDPDLLFFDEPTVGMDVGARARFWTTVKDLAAQGKTVIFSTHYLQEADDVASRILLFNRGRLIADGSPAQVKGQLLRKTVSFKLPDKVSAERLRSLPNVLSMDLGMERIELVTDDTDRLLYALVTADIGASDITIGQGRLEDAFTELTRTEEGVV
ncbi:ABC transporter ATP-binding protein [Bhargavaea beijingensis]|uniref:ABC transporter ATP-binding protein n=2 Tax=Bhargavaea beijingensis TaxID=426756 RepID=A0ABX9ZEK3_9BACL|nr:ABC transporter ATP-binding protein [Bhargavaea beijingensis]